MCLRDLKKSIRWRQCVSCPPTPPILGPSVCSAQQGREIAKHPHRGNAPSMETRPAGECSRSRDDLTLPKSSGSGSELMTQWRPPQRPIERQIMKLYSRDRTALNLSDSVHPSGKNVKIKTNIVVDLSEILADEFWDLKTKKDAIKWIDSIPRKYEKSILATLAFDYINRIR